MALESHTNFGRIVALCSRLGRLTTEQIIDEWEDEPSPENEPLKIGKLIRIAGKPLWLDFRYE